MTTIVGTIGYGAIGYGFGEADRSSKDALQRGGGPLGLLIGFAIPKEWGVSEAASAGVTDAATAAMAATEKKYTYNEDGSITDETGKVYKKDDPKYENVYSDMIQTKEWGVSEAASAGVTDAATAAMAATEKKYTYNEDGSITDETGKVYKKDDPKYENVYSDMIQTKDWDYPVI